MKKCIKCENNIPSTMIIEGKRRNLKNRKYCFECSPFGEHNTIPYKITNIKCTMCDNILHGNQNKYCSNKCKQKGHYNKVKSNPNSMYSQTIRGIKRKYDFIIMKGGCCEECGYNKNISALEFHHISNKKFTLDVRKFSNTRMELLLKELHKCKLLCANCHREHHYPDSDFKLIEAAFSKDVTQL
jgi:hypothetical protein